MLAHCPSLLLLLVVRSCRLAAAAAAARDAAVSAARRCIRDMKALTGKRTTDDEAATATPQGQRECVAQDEAAGGRP
jgi:hypothetical protein